MKKLYCKTWPLLLFPLLLCMSSSQAQENEIRVIRTPQEARAFTLELSMKMNELAEAYRQQLDTACSLYKSFQRILSTTEVVGRFNNASRLRYRLDWYRNPEVDLFKICRPHYYSHVEYDFLILHSDSMKKMLF